MGNKCNAFQQNARRARSTSVTGSSMVPSRKLGGSKHSVKFANPPVSKSADHSRQTTPTPGKRNSESPQPVLPDPFQLYVTGKRLSDWSTMLPQSDNPSRSESERNSEINLPVDGAGNVSFGFYDNLENIARYSGALEDTVGVWKPQGGEREACTSLSLSIDSATLQKMLHPISSERKVWKSSDRLSPVVPSGRPGIINSLETYSNQETSSSASSLEQTITTAEVADIVLRQNEREIIIRETPRTKRSSLHLVAGSNGRFQNITNIVEKENSSKPHSPQVRPHSSLFLVQGGPFIYSGYHLVIASPFSN